MDAEPHTRNKPPQPANQTRPPQADFGRTRGAKPPQPHKLLSLSSLPNAPRGTISPATPNAPHATFAPRGRIAQILLAFALLSTSAVAQAQPDAALVKRVDQHYNHLKSLRARYVEHFTGMGIDRTEAGTLLLKKPSLMRWSYDKPAGKVFVLDGHWAWFYTPGDPQVSRAPAKQLDDLRSPLRFLLGHTELAKELDGLATAAEGAGYRISGVPKGMAGRVRLLTLEVTQAGAIQGMKLEETDGAITEFTFSEQGENVPAAAEDFRFVPPPGLPVVNAQAPL